MSRLQIFFVAIVVSLVSNVAHSETTFPYVAYISAPQTYSRSGPGQQYYPTQQLAQGHAVEVYRHESDGWCAVRPPEGSFCWIPSHEIHRISNTTAEVSVQTTVARVGSTVSPARSAVQVMLRRGEKVQLLPPTPNDDPRWARITPPAGEFRWIAANSLLRTPPIEGATGVQLANGWTRQRFHNEVRPTSGESTEESADSFAHLLQSVPSPQPTYPNPTTATATVVPTPTGTDPDAVQLVAGSPAAIEMANSTSLAPPALMNNSTPLPGSSNPAAQLPAPMPRNSTTPRVRFNSSPTVIGPGSARVQELQLRLSEIVVKPKEEWQFGPLQTEAAAMLEKSDSVSERDHLRNLLDRIAQFQQVQVGQPSEMLAKIKSANASGEFTGQTARVLDMVRNDLGGQAADKKSDPFDGQTNDNANTDSDTDNPDGPRYDAVGRLKPVVSQQDDAPRYALVDDRGGVISFVTPTPDLNLQPYVGMRIGVNGSRGFMPEYRKAHVTAGRVTPIEDRIRR